ncbi:MAG TPA: pyridoxal phosphate-dependent aminotransferase, partial [Terriglobales bacterium]|nr:pyridoxal phosphate-dependent aminotransferase [Terriglobales bacterium]
MFAARSGWKLAPNAFTVALEKRRAAGGEVLDLTESNPTHCGLRYDQAAILAALAQPGALDYHPDPRGLAGARDAVAGYYRERAPGATVPALDHIFLTTSTSEAYTWLFRLLCDPGDEVLVPAPSYPLFDFLAGLQDVRLVPYLLLYDHGWQIDFHSLEKALSARTRAVVVVNPNNPTGSFVKAEELTNLGWLCAPREIALIADEVFLDYPHDRRPRHSLAGQRDTLTFALSGLSKIACLPQMKVAWIAAGGPPDLLAPALARLEVIADTYLSLNTPLQLALSALLEQRHGLQEQLAARIAQNLGELDRRL